MPFCLTPTRGVTIGVNFSTAVTLSEAKGLARWAPRCFAALSMTNQGLSTTSLVILSAAKDLVLIGHGHAPCHSSLKSRQSGLLDSIKATFFARNQPLICFSRARAAFTSDVSSK